MHSATGAPVVGVVGGGQLARMLQPAAVALGVPVRVLALAADESAAQVVPDSRLGRHDDLEALLAFADGCDIVTFDHEHVPPAHLVELERRGIAVRPGPAALVNAQDKITMRESLTAAGIPCPAWAIAETVDDLDPLAQAAGWPLVLKTSRGGYDGRGVWVVGDRAEARSIMESVTLAPGARWLAEARVGFTRELSAQVARSPHGQMVAYPVSRTVQTSGICTEVVAPCPDLADDVAAAAQHIALTIASTLGVVGMLAVELFETPDGVLVNELAMRPHNSGHWTIDGAVTSQFENHLRAVLGGDLPGQFEAFRHVLARDPALKVHLYGKHVRPGRKIGHVTVIGDDLDDLLERAHHAADYLTGAIDE